MDVVPITVYGDKILRINTKKIEAVTDDLIIDIQKMWASMRNASGIGLAANQIGIDKSIFVVDVSSIEDYEHIKPVVMINPEILDYSDEIITYEEGCLSLPNLRADVERSKIIKVRYIDTAETEQIIEADDLFARVILHENDHLIGKMIPDRVAPHLKQKLQGELIKILKREVDIDYPITER